MVNILENNEEGLINEHGSHVREVKKYNPFAMKKKSYKINKKTPIELRKNKHFDEFIKGKFL